MKATLIYLPVKLNDSTWLVVVALDNTSMAVDNRGASSAMLEDNMAARIVNDKRLNLIMMWGMKCTCLGRRRRTNDGLQ